MSISSYWPNILLTIQYRASDIVSIQYAAPRIAIISWTLYIGQYHIGLIVVNTVPGIMVGGDIRSAASIGGSPANGGRFKEHARTDATE